MVMTLVLVLSKLVDTPKNAMEPWNYNTNRNDM